MPESAGRLPDEQEHHRLAFEQYYALGATRTYKKAGAKLNVSPSTLKRWCRQFGWRDRILERDAEAARQIADRSLQEGLADRSRNRKIVHMALMRLAKGIADGKVKMQMADLDRLIRLEAYLAGEPEDRLTWIDRETDPEKLRARLREIAESVEADLTQQPQAPAPEGESPSD